MASESAATDVPGSSWWRTAVVYEIYVRSFASSTGGAVGDLRGITARLDHLVDLGVDALWLTPFYPSPMADHGYDVSNPRDVDPMFGTLEDFDELLAAAHDRGLRVTVDIVPNHFSDAHPWFVTALAAGPGSPERERFIFREGRGAGGEEPPNNWLSTFGGPAWTRVADGQWFLHLFTPEQPDLNWRNPEIGDEMAATLRFWLDRGVDGFRIDVAHGLFKAIDLPDNPGGFSPNLMADVAPRNGMWNQPEVHEVFRRWRRICEEYPQEPMLVGEAWIGDPASLARYVRPDELHLVFNFRLLSSPFEAATMAEAIDASTAQLRAVGAAASWVLSNHDVVRHPTRYGGGAIGADRARAALLLILALPGAVFLYQGEELGLEEIELPDEALQDPIWQRTGHALRGRDGCRVPLPWSGTAPPYGFTTGSTTWLPQPVGWGSVTVAAEAASPESMLAFYRRALAVRTELLAAGGGRGTATGLSVEASVLRVSVLAESEMCCMVNLGAAAVPLPAGDIVLASAPVTDRMLAPNAAVWLSLSS